ncbi:RHS repeat domain-containing protein [Pseudomonas sp. Marseille-P9899]|uniref:RHS repeat domain-containing protein n=1 Tax=Pseudomonas sp. Marseille-P9899 TaxID=2730401 RepID=UPI001588D35E|nr:RHS repeat protein [Pseudomonas sp. Marseille-P9899]
MTTSSNIHSNAFNFLSFVETGVDPRTGQYTCSLSLPELEGNDLSGPNVPLRLSYNPLNTVDSGFGKSWNLQLSQYDTFSGIVSLASGETFKVTSTSSDGSGQLLMKEQKIPSFRLFDIGNNRFRVVHKSGLVEELATETGDPVALPVIQYSPQGHRITLSYTAFSGGRLLNSITNADGVRLLGIIRGASNVSVSLHGGLHQASFKLIFEGSDARVIRVELPTDPVASWRFGYATHSTLLCINRVEGPLGGRETIEYDNRPHQFPGDSGRTLPRVSRHLHDPGADQPTIDTRYEYSDNNFLGRNAPGLSWDDDGLDNLYKIPGTYTYSTVEQLWDAANNRARRSITRTFNRFHLISEELTEQGDAVKRVRTHYYADDSSLPFDQQPAQCQLPKTVTTTWYRKSTSGQTRDEVVRSEYDIHGNLTLQVQANGISEASEYYPASASDGCPADPHGFVRHLKQKTVTPGQGDVSDAPVLRTQHRYISQPALVGSGSTWPWLALEQETLVHVNGGNAELQKTRHTYINMPTDNLTHGRKAQTAVTLNGKTTSTDYAYAKVIGQYAGQLVLRTLETLKTSFDAVSKVIILEHSLLNGRPLLERDDNDVEIAYAYDKLGRVTEEKVAPGSSVEALREYRYLLVNQVTGQPTQTAIDVKGVETRSVLDGLQRVVSELRQDVDGNPATRPLRQTYSATYDAFGQLSESTEFDWLGSQTTALTSRYTYDEWGEQDSVTGPDGVTDYTRTDPVALRVETWREGMGKTVTQNNLFEKPVTVERFDLAGGKVSLYEYFYDGLGRTSHEYDELRQFRFYQYDAFDRMTLNGLPDSAQVERRYADHSTEDLPTWIGVDGVVLGEQAFDGLERLYRSVTGGRERTFAFDGGQQQPSSVTTPKGEVIAYEYNPNLGEEPIQRRIQGATADYEYDKDNAQLLSSRESDQSLNCTYYSTGELKTEQRVNAGKTHEMAYEYSLRGRLLSYTDVLGQQQRYEYDGGGRLESTTLGQTESHFSYNSSGLTSRIVTEDTAEGHSVRIDLEYDDFGREILRTFTFDDGVVQTLEQRYTVRDALEQRILRQGSTLLRDETYAYDARGRLEDYRCTGSDLPLDPWGKSIQRQVFEFDALDNLITVRTVFPGGENLATYLFEDQDPTQLSAVRNSHADYPALMSLDYDEDGNLVRDEQDRSLEYDALGRLLSVSDASTGILQYRYDAQDILSGSVGGEGDEQRFYCDGQLVNQLQGDEQRTFIRGGEHVLAERLTGEGDLLLVTDAKKHGTGRA